MNFETLTSDDLRAIDPTALESLLAADGWQARDLDLPASLWVPPGRDEGAVLVPHDRAFDDYLPRLREAVDLIRAVYDDRWPALLVRVLAPLADVMRFRAAVDTPADGSIDLSAGLELFDGARAALEAATRATVGDKRPTYGSRGWKQVREYLSKARLGQTERGSYVVTVISRLTLDGDLGEAVEPLALPEIGPDEPFERKVNVLFVSAVEAAQQAATEFRNTNDFDAFQEAVAVGASAELCSAVLQMIDSGHPLEISVDPSPSIAWPDQVPRVIRVEPDARGPLETATFRYKESKTVPNARVTGGVEVLSRRSEEGPGVVNVHVLRGAEAKTVKVRLEAADYDLAITTHRERKLLSATGSLVKEGKYTWLYDASDLRVTDPEPDESLF